MAALCDSSVDFIENIEEDEDRETLNRRHQELVRKLKNKINSDPALCTIEPVSTVKAVSNIKSNMVSATPAMTLVTGQEVTMKTSKDPVSLIEEGSLDENCGIHSYKTEMFCRDCRVLSCALCFLFGQHKGHDSADIGETRSGFS